MVSLTSVLVVFSLVSSVFAHHRTKTGLGLHRKQSHKTLSHKHLSPRSTQNGQNNGWYYQYWTDGGGKVNFTLADAGGYSVVWSGNGGNFVGGKGWLTGSGRAINFHGSFNPNGVAYLAVYGWFRDPLVEYYVLESYGSYDPGHGGTLQGTVDSDGDTYDIYTVERVGDPSIVAGAASFQQYWSIRRMMRTSGTVTMDNHLTAWTGLGLPVGSFDYQILAVEGYHSSGTASMVVSKGYY